jgi:signal transduction histidine kinase
MKFPFRRPGIRWRMAMLYLGIFTVGLSVFCTVLFQYFQATQAEAFDATLYNFAVDISSNLEMDPHGRLIVINSNMAEAIKIFPFPLVGSLVEIRDLSGHELLHSRSLGEKNLPLDQATVNRLLREKFLFQTLRAETLGLTSTSSQLRVVTYLAQHPDWGRPLILQVAVPLDIPHREQRDMLLFLAFAIPVFLSVSGAAGIWMSKRALKPVHDMTLKAHGISGVGNLNERIPVPEAEDEIRELAVTFNGLLERLDKAFASQDRFIANASHQLRTPLTILKGELDLLRKSNPGPDELKSTMESVGVEINRLIQLVQDLLLLARLEAGRDTISFSPVRVDEVLLRVVARMQKLAKLKNVQIKTHFSADLPGSELEGEVSGDDELLDSMFENFMENAVKYSPSDSTVNLEMRVHPEIIEIRISDAGPGIPPDQRQKIFERFTRVQPSHIVPGSGLGLAIAAEIASLHNVKIDLSEAHGSGGGTQVILIFPRS